jgi:hypothetical protein
MSEQLSLIIGYALVLLSGAMFGTSVFALARKQNLEAAACGLAFASLVAVRTLLP